MDIAEEAGYAQKHTEFKILLGDRDNLDIILDLLEEMGWEIH